MSLIKRLLIKCKWKMLRYLTKRKIISFHMMIRMHYIQKLEQLGYDKNKLLSFSYKKLKNIFIKEFPNEYIHKPNRI